MVLDLVQVAGQFASLPLQALQCVLRVIELALQAGFVATQGFLLRLQRHTLELQLGLSLKHGSDLRLRTMTVFDPL